MGALFGVFFAYLLGSVSAAVLVTKFFDLPDPRTQGSGNAGATNVLRTSGKKAAVIVLAMDVAKGFLAVVVGVLLGAEGALLGFVALAAVLGHIFPVFYGFRGGKGVATTAGALLALSLGTLFFALIIFASVLYFSRFVSLSSIVTAIALPILLLLGGNYVYCFPFLVITLLILWKHSSNIQRLRAGKEKKVSLR